MCLKVHQYIEEEIHDDRVVYYYVDEAMVVVVGLVVLVAEPTELILTLLASHV